MSKLQHLLEVAVEGPATDGSVAHRRSLHSWYSDKFAKSQSMAVGACTTQPKDAPPAKTWFAYSGGWALSKGAVACTEQACFPGGVA